MAKRVQVLLVDDLDHTTPADETVSFALDGVSYSIDLSADNAARLRTDLATWVGHAERVGGRKSSGRATGRSGRSRGDLNAVRAWARSNGRAVKDRGRIPADILAAYDKANG